MKKYIVILIIGMILGYVHFAYSVHAESENKNIVNKQYKVVESNIWTEKKIENILNNAYAEGWKYIGSNSSWIILEKRTDN